MGASKSVVGLSTRPTLCLIPTIGKVDVKWKRRRQLSQWRLGLLRWGQRRWTQALRLGPQTWVHGDAKIANFLFGPDCAAAVDFQYVGGGCGMVDVAYFLGSALTDEHLGLQPSRWLDVYFGLLSEAGCPQLEAVWRPLYPVAWADFMRFMQGWAPGHARGARFGWRMVDEALRLRR